MPQLSWTLNPEIMGLAILSAGDAAAMLSAANPSIFTVRTFRSEGNQEVQENTARDIYIGSAIGGSMALLIGYGASLVSASWYPLAITAAALVVYLGAYQWALMTPHNTHGSIARQG